MTMTVKEEAEKAWPGLEQWLSDEFHVAVYSRNVTDQPPQSGWGAALADHAWTIVMGVDLKEDDPRAGQLPVQLNGAEGTSIPVRYYYCGPISKQTP